MSRVTVRDERQFWSLDRDGWTDWWAWLTDVVGGYPGAQRIVELTLGEGVLMGLVHTGAVVDDEPELIPVAWPAPVPPPCWPPQADFTEPWETR